MGTTTVMSHAAGRKDRDQAVLLFNQSQVLSLACGVVFLLVMMTLRVSYTRVLSADPVTAALAADYLLWFIPAMSLQFAMVAMGSALRGTGNFKPGMIVQTATVVLNMLLAPILIFGWFTGYPMGVAGAANRPWWRWSSACSGCLATSRLATSPAPAVGRLAAPLRHLGEHAEIGLPAGAEFALTAVYLFIVYTVCRPIRRIRHGPRFGVGLRLVGSMFLPVKSHSPSPPRPVATWGTSQERIAGRIVPSVREPSEMAARPSARSRPSSVLRAKTIHADLHVRSRSSPHRARREPPPHHGVRLRRLPASCSCTWAWSSHSADAVPPFDHVSQPHVTLRHHADHDLVARARGSDLKPSMVCLGLRHSTFRW